MFLYSLHLAGMAASMGGLITQLVLLSKSDGELISADRIRCERAAAVTVRWMQVPGVLLSAVTGLALAWVNGWGAFQEGWLQFKLLFFLWIVLGTRIMWRNARNIVTLGGQCGKEDSGRLSALKDHQRMIGYVTGATFLFAMAFSIWRPV